MRPFVIVHVRAHVFFVECILVLFSFDLDSTTNHVMGMERMELATQRRSARRKAGPSPDLAQLDMAFAVFVRIKLKNLVFVSIYKKCFLNL